MLIVVSTASDLGVSGVVAFRPRCFIFPVVAKRKKRRTEPDLDLINRAEQVATLRLEGPARRFARISEYGIPGRQ